ncbi:NRDE family protein [Halobaculum sp. D14]|uniref:NRDE family protein n=1 Tax=Halobaculum sp. D14 TaxID=3421642 RepID=UPI003EBAC594
MCTLTIAWRTFRDAPVVVAANRDEAVDRPAEPPAERDEGIVAPRDAEAGGTWMGATRDGLFVGVTNRWVEGLAGERSRGLLVDDCLHAESAEAAARLVESRCRDHEYDGFNLVVADADAALLLEWDGHLSVTPFEPGVHVVVNVGADGAFVEPPDRPDVGPEQAANARRLRDHLQVRPDESASSWLRRAGDALGDHEFGVCVHGDGYGTVSSSLLLLGADGSRRYEYAAGPPCETPYEVVYDE